MEWPDEALAEKAVIACFAVFGVLILIFIFWEWRSKEDAILPLSFLRNRTQIGAAIEGFMLFMLLLVGLYYLPLWYQAQGHSATRSGIDILSFQLSTVLAAIISGGSIKFRGRYKYFLVFSPLLASVGSGLLYTVHADTSNARMIGYQIIMVVGLGGAFQNTIIAIQDEYADREHLVPQSTAIVSWSQLLGGIIAIAIAGTLLANRLVANIPKDLPADVAHAVRQSVTVTFTLPQEQQSVVIDAYVKSIDRVFLIGVPAGVLASLSALLISNHNLKERSKLQATTLAG